MGPFAASLAFFPLWGGEGGDCRATYPLEPQEGAASSGLEDQGEAGETHQQHQAASQQTDAAAPAPPRPQDGECATPAVSGSRGVLTLLPVRCFCPPLAGPGLGLKDLFESFGSFVGGPNLPVGCEISDRAELQRVFDLITDRLGSMTAAELASVFRIALEGHGGMRHLQGLCAAALQGMGDTAPFRALLVQQAGRFLEVVEGLAAAGDLAAEPAQALAFEMYLIVAPDGIRRRLRGALDERMALASRGGSASPGGFLQQQQVQQPDAAVSAPPRQQGMSQPPPFPAGGSRVLPPLTAGPGGARPPLPLRGPPPPPPPLTRAASQGKDGSMAAVPQPSGLETPIRPDLLQGALSTRSTPGALSSRSRRPRPHGPLAVRAPRAPPPEQGLWSGRWPLPSRPRPYPGSPPRWPFRCVGRLLCTWPLSIPARHLIPMAGSLCRAL